jgi:SAM-dependent methyltransferase
MRDTNELLNETLDAVRQPPYGPRRKSRAMSGGRIAAFLIALLLLPLAGVSAPRKDVRYEPSPFPVVRAMLELANVGPNDVVYDLGSGDGRIVIMAAKEFGARGVGIDVDPELIAEARANARKAGVENKVQFIEGNMFDADLRPATVVTLFLHPEPNLRLRPKLLAELKPGSRIVSYIWDLGDWKPDAERTAANDKIYLWRVPEPARR